MHTQKHQAGLSLIELMVALAISSFLILGITQIYIDNKRSYIFQQNQSENQENSRFTLLLLQNELAKAGYRRIPDMEVDEAFPATAANSNDSGCGAFSAGQTVKFISRSAICIRFEPRDSTDRDCLGGTVLTATAAAITDPYSATPEIYVEQLWFNAATNELRCRRGAAANAGALVSGMLDLRFELGTGANQTDRNITAYSTADPSTNPILAVRYIGLMRSSNQGQRENAGATAVAALARWRALSAPSTTSYNEIRDADTGQLYQIAQGTVTLRNRTP